MNPAEIHHAIHRAAVDTTRLLSSHLRKQARASAWPEHIIRHMRVSYNGEEFNLHVHPEHHADAHVLEYGAPGFSPTAAVRRFGNRTKEAEQFFVKRLGAEL